MKNGLDEKMAVLLLLLLEKFLPSTLFWVQEQNSFAINWMRTSSYLKGSLKIQIFACWYSQLMGVSFGERELHSGTPAMAAVQLYLHIPTLYYQFHFYGLPLTSLYPNVNISLS